VLEQHRVGNERLPAVAARTVDERRSTVVTVPSTPSISMTSPICTRRSTSRIMPLMKFLMMVCVPKPTPIASAPPRNANTDSGIRARLSVSSTSANDITATIQRRNVRTRSAFRPFRTIHRSTCRARRPMTQ
jgi:hypothetical protein